MTQTQVMGHLADKIGISKKEAKLTLDELNALVVRELKKEGSIRLAGLGIFRKRRLKARVGKEHIGGLVWPSVRNATAVAKNRSRAVVTVERPIPFDRR